MRVKFYPPLFLFFFVLILNSSCKKNLIDNQLGENNILNTEPANGLSIGFAKSWYEQNATNIQALRTTGKNTANFKIHSPFWDKGIYTGDSNYFIIEVPLQFDKSPGFIITNSATTPGPAEANDAVKLLILKNRKSGIMKSALMHVVSDDGVTDNTNTYSKRNSHFTGFIFFTNLDGSFINGWKYQDGKITMSSSQKTTQSKTSKRINVNEALSLVAPPPPQPVSCSSYTVVYEERYCSGDNCTPWMYVGEDTYTYCTGGGGGGGTGGGGGIQYTEYDTPAPETPNPNQDIIDSLKNYPCAQEILKQLPSINAEVDSIIKKIFGVNDDANLKFSADNSLSKDSMDGYTRSASQLDGSVYSFIKLNPWVLENSTKEYILVTMLHEAIHSYIDYWYAQYNAGIIDSTTFKNRFPIFWNYKKVLKDPVEIAQHNEMANNYVNTMKSAIKSYNPNASDAAAEALAWGGLQQTTVWKSQSDTTTILNINWNSRDAGLNQFSQYNFQKCPGNQTSLPQ